MTTYISTLDSADIHHLEDAIFITLPDDAKAGDTLRLVGEAKSYDVVLSVVRKTGWQKHKHLARFECDRNTAHKLREALTYEVIHAG